MIGAFWATEERAGVMVPRGDGWLYVDEGAEFEAAVTAGPLPPRDLPAIPDPRAPVVPQSVSALQAKAALMMAGVLPVVEAAIAAADPLTQLAWAEAGAFDRDSVTIAGLAAQLNWDAARLDAFFVAAAAIKF